MADFVIVVDAQVDFIHADGALPVPGAAELVGPINEFLSQLRPERTAGVLFTFDTHSAEFYPGSAEAQQFPPHCYQGTPGWALAVDGSAVAPQIPTFQLRKGVFDMWAEPDLVVEPLHAPNRIAVSRDAFFDQLRASGINDVIVVGVAADFCVRWAVEGLVARGFRVTVPHQLTRGIECDIASVAADIDSPLVSLA